MYFHSNYRQADNFDVVTKRIVGYIRKTREYGNNIVKALRTEREVHFNEMLRRIPDPGTNPTEIEKVVTSRCVEKVIDQEKCYKVKLIKTFAILYGQCTKGVQSKL